MDAIRIEDILDLRDPRGLAGVALRRVRASHRAVDILETIGANEILSMQRDASFTKAMRRALHAQVSAIQGARERIDAHNALGLVIDTGRAIGLWDHDGIGMMHLHAMAPSRIREKTAARSRNAEALRDAFARRLPEILASDDPGVLHGAAILSMLLFDALLSPALVDALEDVERFTISGEFPGGEEARDPQPQETGEAGATAATATPEMDALARDAGEWVALRHRVGLRPGDTQWRIRRWPVGVLTRTIFRRILVCENRRRRQSRAPDDAQDATATAGGAQAGRAWRVVVTLGAGLASLREHLNDPLLPTSRRQVMTLARAYWSLRLPPVLFDIASDASACEGLPDGPFERLVHGRRVVVKRPVPRTAIASWAGDTYTCGAPNPDQREHLRALVALRSLLRNLPTNAFKAAQEVRLRLAKWLDAYAAVGGWCVILAYWVDYAVGSERARDRGKPLRPSSILRYLSSYARWLVPLCQDLDPATVDEPTLMGRLDVLARLASQRSAHVRQVALQEFLIFAERFGAPAIDLVDWWGVPPRGGRPRVNIVTPREYPLVLRRIDQVFRGQEGSYGCRRMRAMFLLFYWAGPRWSELAWLPSGAIVERGIDPFQETDLYVRYSKTPFGERRLPLHQLMPPDALAEVRSYARDLVAGAFGTLPEGALLFGEPGDRTKPPARDEVHDRLQRILRWVTGDEGSIIHDLRHTAAGNIALRLLMPTGAAWPSCLVPVSDVAFDVPPRAESWATWVTGWPHHDHQRCAALAGLLGHIDAHVTLGHYVHLAEVVLRATTSRYPPRVPDRVMAQILGTKAATLKKARERARKRR